ncbi:hypothetical protein SBADM41S_02433 [Streptomyces badius]
MVPAAEGRRPRSVSAQVEDARVQDLALLERGADRPVQTVLQVEVALPLHDVREQVPVERGVLGEEGLQVQLALGGDELVQANRTRRDIRPLAGGFPAVVGVRLPFPMRLKITRKAYRSRATGRSHGSSPLGRCKGRIGLDRAGYRGRSLPVPLPIAWFRRCRFGPPC